MLPLRTAKVQPTTTNWWNEPWRTGSLLVEVQNDTTTLETKWLFSYKTEQTLTTPTYIIISITNYPKEWKNLYSQKDCTQMFVAALFIIVKTQKQSRCPPVDE